MRDREITGQSGPNPQTQTIQRKKMEHGEIPPDAQDEMPQDEMQQGGAVDPK